METTRVFEGTCTHTHVSSCQFPFDDLLTLCTANRKKYPAMINNAGTNPIPNNT